VQNASTSKFCVSSFRTCRDPVDDCFLLGSACADVDNDNDGLKECVGKLHDNDKEGCVNNVDCGGSAPPVCEIEASSPNVASCGDYGLCLIDNDCGAGFVCAALWQDGRKECVQMPPTPLPQNYCEKVTDCPPQQVCAAPRNGGSPSCQAGKEAM
jgi:hypothetical protein